MNEETTRQRNRLWRLLFLATQEPDLCLADARFCLVCFDELQEMQSSETISGNDRPIVLRHAARRHRRIQVELEELSSIF